MILTALTEREKDLVLAGGIVGMFFAIVAIAFITWYILLVVASWKMFKKAGEPGWKSVIPVYNAWILYKIAGVNFWIWLIIPAILCGATQSVLEAAGKNPSGFAYALFIVTVIYAVIASWKFAKGLAKSFGKGIGFTIGLFIQPISDIFYLILGFGKSKYKKSK